MAVWDEILKKVKEIFKGTDKALDQHYSANEKAEIEALKMDNKRQSEIIQDCQKRMKEQEKLIPIPDKEAEEWNDKWPKSTITYKAQNGIIRDVRNLICDKSFVLNKVVQKWKVLTDEEKVYEAERYVKNNMRYKGDFETHKATEFWQHPEESFQTGEGDCFAGYEEIYTKDGLKKIENIKVGDEVLSYDFNKQEYVYKKVKAFWKKGNLQINRVHLRNGQYFDVSEKHPLWVRTNQQGKSKYEKKYLLDIDLTRCWKRKLPIAKRIPYVIEDIDWITEELCFVVGHFLAEGWIEKSHVSTSGYELIEEIIPILEKNKIPFSEYTNNSGVPCVRFLESSFKVFLKRQKKDSFDIHLEEYFFKLPENKLQALLDGFFLGDGHNGNYPDKRGFKSNKQEVYSTISEQWARNIQRIGLQIGKTFHIWKQTNHKGLGNKPIYRITFNPESHFLKDFGYKDISEVSIRYIEKLENVKMYDLTVEDTHTVILKNGIITHQCEDGALLIISLALLSGVKPHRIKACAGFVENPSNPKEVIGHAYAIFLRDDKTWCVCDWCYYPDNRKICDREEHKNLPKYKEIWFTFNSQYCFNQTNVII